MTTKQNVENIQNSTYELTAWVKSSGGQAQAVTRVLNHGRTEIIDNIPAAAGWVQVTLGIISVSTNKALIAFTLNAQAGQWMKVDDVVFE